MHLAVTSIRSNLCLGLFFNVTFLQLGRQLAATVRNDPGSTSRDNMDLAINACNIGLDIEDVYDWPHIAEWAGVAYMLDVSYFLHIYIRAATAAPFSLLLTLWHT